MKIFLIVFLGLIANFLFAQNSLLHNNSILSFNDSTFLKLPVYNLSSELNLFNDVFLLNNSDGYYNNMQSINNSIFLDEIPINMINNFPYFIIDEIKSVKNASKNGLGNSLGGNLILSTKKISDSLSITINIRKDIPWFSFKNLHDSPGNIMEGMFEVNGKFNITEKFKPQFLIAWDIKNDAEPFPTYQTKSYININTINNLYDNPVVKNGLGVVPSADYASGDIYSNSRFLKNDNINSNNFYGKIIFPITNKLKLTIGNFSVTKNGKIPVYENQLMNWWNNPNFKEKYILSYLNFEQILLNSEEINIKYNINCSFSHYTKTTENNDYKKDFFRYGYAGNFKSYKAPYYSFTDTLNGFPSGIWQQNGFADTSYFYTQNVFSNAYYSNWNNMYYNIVPHNAVVFNNSYLYYQAGGGLLNGDIPDKIYDLWNNPGVPYNNYSESEENNFYLSGNFNIKINKIEINFGGDFNKKISRNYSINANYLWTLARNLTNIQLQELDHNNPHYVYDANGVFQDTVWYDRLYNSNLQTYFDFMFRNSLGLQYNSTQLIETDSYNPSDFSIEMFSADEILNSNIIQTNGYDYTGKKLTNYSYSDFFTIKNNYGANYRPVKAFEPTSYNIFINTKYNYKKFDIEAGIKLNAYNSNQPVLDDPYSFYKIKKAGEVTSINGNAVSHPSNIGSNYAVYVNNLNNPTSIMGYRNGNIWYDYLGNRLSNYAYMSQPYVVPYLANPNIYSETFFSDNFKSYKTVYNILPFIQLNYNFSNYLVYCNFYSNSQNPGYESVFNPINYGYFSNSTFLASNYRGVYTNSALKPTSSNTIEGGIYNYLGKNAKIGLSYKYSETANIIDIRKYINAFPYEYYSFYNTPNILVTHGLTFTVNINKIFKTGFDIGGSACAQQHVSNSGIYNLYFPDVITKSWLTYTVDNGVHGNTNFYKYFSKHFTLSMLLHYRKMTTFTQFLSSYYNNNLPMPAGKHNINLNLSIQKSFYTFNNQYVITTYIIIENILNTQNLLFYYAKTGNANDDGYLADLSNQLNINTQNNPEAYRDYYRIYANNPSNYDIPRILRIGLKIGF